MKINRYITIDAFTARLKHQSVSVFVMGTIELKKIWFSINTVLTSINLMMLSILFSMVLPQKIRPSKVPLIANAILLIVIILIFSFLINSYKS